MINKSVITPCLRTLCWNKNVSKYRNIFKFTYSIQTFMSTTLLSPKNENKYVCEKFIPNDYTLFLCSSMIIQSTVIRKIVLSMFDHKKILVGTSLLSNLHLIVLKISNLILFYLKKRQKYRTWIIILQKSNQIKSKIVLHFYHVICKII